MVNTQDARDKRRAAMAVIKAELARMERTQAWLIRRLEERHIVVKRQVLSNYLNGYRRVPRVVLAEACAIVGTTMERVLAAVGDDEAVLIQTPRSGSTDGNGKAA